MWLHSLSAGAELRSFPDLTAATGTVAARVSPIEARRNLEELDLVQSQLHSNVQEALALEVGFLKLKL